MIRIQNVEWRSNKGYKCTIRAVNLELTTLRYEIHLSFRSILTHITRWELVSVLIALGK